MSLSVLTRGGGGGFYPSIFITGLSEADTVTATKDGKTANGKWNSTEGRFEITKIKDLGTWTVTATNGEKTKTQDVLVDAALEYEIEMYYKLWLYRAGDECKDVTGGWVAQGLGWETAYNNPQTPTLTKNATNMVMSRTSDPGYACGIILPKNRIDFTKYKTLNVVISSATISPARIFAGFYRSELGSVCVDGTRWFSLGGYVEKTQELVSTDISSRTGLFVPYFGLYSTGSGTIHEMWLE